MNYLAQLNIFNVSKANFKETKKFLFCFKLLERKKVESGTLFGPDLFGPNQAR